MIRIPRANQQIYTFQIYLLTNEYFDTNITGFLEIFYIVFMTLLVFFNVGQVHGIQYVILAGQQMFKMHFWC